MISGLADGLATMLEKLKNWFFARALNRHRLLFRYWDGSRFVSADPFVLLRRMLNTTKFDADADVKALSLPEPTIVAKKIGFIAEGIREIFELKPFEQGGLSELECVNLLMLFSDFLNSVKKNGVSSLISSPLMASSTMDASTDGENAMNENLVST